MNTEYFFVKPSCFKRYGDINIDGEFDLVSCSDFNVTDPRENVILLEVKYDEYNGEKTFSSYAKEIVSGKKFNLNFNEIKGNNTLENVKTVVIKSEDLGLYSGILLVSEIENKPSKVSGLFYHLLDNEEEKANYCKYLRDMFEEAKSRKYIYDRNIDGPSTYLKNQMRKVYKKTE